MKAARRGVLIVGAGPTGLTLANCLARYGVPFQLVEKNAGLSQDSKALAINILTQESFALLGIEQVIGRNGCRVSRLNVSWQQTRLLPVDFRRLSAEPRALITQPQRHTEQELLESLPHRVSPRWQTELSDIREAEDSVIARLRGRDGREWEETYDFVVGCEGKHSLVRERLGASFDGAPYGMHFVLGDFPVGWDAPRSEAHYFAFDDVFFVVAPVSATHFRFVVKRSGPFSPNQPLDPDQIVAPVREYLGKRWIAGPPSWLSRAPFYARIASKLRRGRLLICGDAAHLYSPIGGTGMNTGMQDAFNLAWKIAYVFHGYAGAGLLDSYESERREVIEGTATATEVSTKLLGGPHRPPEQYSSLLPTLRNRHLLNRLPLLHGGLNVSYSDSTAICRRDGSTPAGTFHRGAGALRRLLDAEAPSSLVPKALLTDVLVHASPAALARCRTELNVLREDLRPFSNVRYSILAHDATNAERPPRDGVVSVLRPDGFVAKQSALIESAALAPFLRKLHDLPPHRGHHVP